MKKVEISRCFVEPTYSRVQSEEGPYDAICGYTIIAQSKPDANGNYGYWVHTGKPTTEGDQLATCYVSQDLAEKIAHSYQTQGFISLVFWYCFDEKNVNDLPDYVTDPSNPMFN